MSIVTEVKEADLKKVFLLGGQVVVTNQPQILVTILGSCVSVCLWDRKTLLGGMNHYLLPETVNDAKSLNGGITSTRVLIQTMVRKLPGAKNLEAQIFGGANRFFAKSSFLNVGQQNVEAARIILEEAGIRLVYQDTGGEAGRKIYFNTLTGQVEVKRIYYENGGVGASSEKARG